MGKVKILLILHTLNIYLHFTCQLYKKTHAKPASLAME